MRRLPLGIAISVALHVGAVAWLATTGEARVLPAPHREPVEVEIVPVAPEPEPLAVAIVADPAPAAAAPAPVPARRPAPRAEARASVTGHDEVAAPSEPVVGPPGPRSALMTMRGRGAPRIEHGLSDAFIADLAARGKPAPPEVPESGQLAPAAGGRHTSAQGPFRVDVDRDGAAHITDGPNFHVGVAVPRPKDIGRAIAKWQEDPYADPEARARQKLGDYRSIAEDSKPNSPNVVPIPLIGGGFDVTDALMRRHGADPYASKKLRVLDATRDERVQIGERFRKQQLLQATAMMKAAVDRLWASNLDVAAKKRALFELWDDCADTGPAELVEAGGRARAYVVGFVNAVLPPGGAAAFSSEELAQLNAHRQSRAAFAPYGS